MRAEGAAQQRGHQEAGQREVSEMIGSDLQFEAICREPAFGKSHHAGIVDQQIQRTASG